MGKLSQPPARLSSPPALLRQPPKIADGIYLSPEWRALMRTILAERGRFCEQCGAGKCRLYGDHIIELRDGGLPFDKSNVRLLCAMCHGRKTAAERAKRAMGRT